MSHTKQISDIVDKIFNQQSECHFASDAKAVCSPKNMITKMKQFVKEKDPAKLEQVTGSLDDLGVVNITKEVLNCNSESCIFKRPDFIEFANLTKINDILTQFFKPDGPATHFGLLSNFNIDDVLDQLAVRFKNRNFLHIPFQMRDFEKIGTQLATVDLANKLKSEGYKTFGVVLNTDWSTGGGIHWFCLFGEHMGDHISLEYFNSSGKEPLPEIQAWLQKTKHYLKKELNLPVEIHYTTGIQFQNDDHSCGVYSIAYIWLRLEGVPYTWFKANNFNDEMMHKLRKNVFRWGV